LSGLAVASRHAGVIGLDGVHARNRGRIEIDSCFRTQQADPLYLPLTWVQSRDRVTN
jgi:hypothetical protein